MSRFKCTSPRCSFDAQVPDAPVGPDAMRCLICGDIAILVDPRRPAFRCPGCGRVFRASGSTGVSERCEKCGAQAARVDQ